MFGLGWLAWVIGWASLPWDIPLHRLALAQLLVLVAMGLWGLNPLRRR